MLDAVLDGVGLQKLGGVDQVFEGRGIEVVVREIPENLAVAALALLMVLHHPGEAVHVCFLAEGADGLHGGEALKAVLGAEAEVLLPVGGEGDAAVPDLPVVGVALGRVVRIVEAAAGGGAGGPVEGVRRVALTQLRQQVAVEPGVVVPHQLVVPGAPVEDAALHFVVAAEQPQRGVVVQPLEVAGGLLGELPGHLFGQVDVGAGYHEVLPDQDAVLVAVVEEAAVRVVTAAPDAQSVEIGVHRLAHQGFPPRRRYPAEEVVHGDHVGAHGEDLHAVEDKAELAALFVLVRLRADGEGPETQLLVAAVDHLAAVDQLNLEVVERLVAVTAHPPKPGVVHGNHAVAVLQKNSLTVQGGVNFAAGTVTGGDGQLHRDGAAAMVLPNGHVLQLIHVIGNQLHGTEDAHVGQRRTPVPAGLIQSLAQMGRAGDGVAVVHVEVVLVLCRGKILPGGLELQPQAVFAPVQQGLHAVAVDPVHILNFGQQRAVEIDVAEGVQAVEDQVDVVSGQERRIRVDHGGKGAVLLGQVLQLPLIEPIEGVGNLFVIVQDAVHRAGGLAREGLIALVFHDPVLDVHRSDSSPVG